MHPSVDQPFATLRVALVHDWLVTLRGGERVLDALCELFPQATIHTLVRVPGVATPRIEAMRHVTSFADRLPLAHRHHRWLLPLYPTAIESLDLSAYDLVVSSSHCVAKAVIAAPGAVHVCYCHTPVRYAWDRTEDYVRGSHPLLQLARPALTAAAGWLRRWDLQTVGRVDAFVANSENTASKIRKFYDRDAVVVVPPVECERFAGPPPRREYDLVLGGMVPYKRVDLAIEAYRQLPDRQLVLVGDGPERQRLQRTAPANVRFVGRVSEEELRTWYAGARCLVFPGEEDFGIVPLEAQAAGVPVLAFGRGGALESVVEGRTGVFFHEPTAESLVAAVRRVDALLATRAARPGSVPDSARAAA
jgi:glycosyltransferase involved in cell wall biosynthesis